jgi:transcriptional regulator with XRE-family HTH domain
MIMSLGKKILDLRTQKKLKQDQVAYDLEVSQSTYSGWENDIIIPKRENLVKLAEYFGVQVEDFEEEIYKVNFKSIKNSVALINSPYVSIKNSTEAIIKISDTLEKLTELIEKLLVK